MKRYRLKSGERSSRYKPGQFVSADYAERYPDKVKRQRRKHAPPIESEAEEYEITVEYRP